MKHLRLLIVEDSDDDELLVLKALRNAGFQVTHKRAETRDQMLAAIDREKFDMVLSDYHLPDFDGPSALETLRGSTQPDIPFVLVSGNIGEESVVAALKAGANNYLLKHSLTQLPRVVERELRDAKTRRERDQAFIALEQAVKARDQFLSLAAHELKTPLTALTLEVQQLARTSENARNEARIERIDRSCARLAELVDRLLDFTRASTGPIPLQIQEADLVERTKAAIARVSPTLRESQSTISLTAPPKLLARFDWDRIEVVLTNLLSNAVRFGNGKPIEVLLEQKAGQALVHVIDHGIGINAADQRRIFERFERAVPERHYGGFGIGLWLAQEIVEAHGGHVDLKSEPGVGSTFTVRLPL
jgi:signal transduction histidine kinase